MLSYQTYFNIIYISNWVYRITLRWVVNDTSMHKKARHICLYMLDECMAHVYLCFNLKEMGKTLLASLPCVRDIFK